MHLNMGFLKRYSLVIGLLLMFVLTWPTDLANSGVINVKVPFAIYITLGYGFVVASILMTWLISGRDAVIALVKRFLIWRVGLKWYLIALFLFPVLQFVSVLLASIATQTSIDFSQAFAYEIFGESVNLPLMIIPFLLFDAVTNGEEIGWRGYVLPRLQAKFSALGSSIIVGVIWGLWHLPKFLGQEASNPFGLFMIKIMLEAVIYTWVYNNTKGSLLIVTLLHAASNTAGVFLPIASTVGSLPTALLFLQLALYALVVLIIVLISGPATLSRKGLRQVVFDLPDPAVSPEV